MHYPANAVRALLRHDAQRVRCSFTGMNDKRLPTLPGSADMLPETLPLPLQIAFEAKVIQSGFTDSDYFWMISQRYQLRSLRFGQVFVIGMNADGSKQIGM